MHLKSAFVLLIIINLVCSSIQDVANFPTIAVSQLLIRKEILCIDYFARNHLLAGWALSRV